MENGSAQQQLCVVLMVVAPVQIDLLTEFLVYFLVVWTCYYF